jgi:hypothetical protein
MTLFQPSVMNGDGGLICDVELEGTGIRSDALRAPSGKLAAASELSHSEQGRATTRALSCSTTAGLGGRAGCSSGLPYRHRSPSPMEYVPDEAG